MATNNKWERHEYFQKHGVYPETIKQEQDRLAKERDLAENGPSESASEPGHGARSEAQNRPKNDPVARAVEQWHRDNPGFRR
jgi:hypothetical protein